MYEFTQFDQINPLTGEGYPTGEQPPPSNDPPPTVARENWQKKNHPPEIEKKIIGVVDAILCPAAPGNPAVTVSKFDTTTYIDRAIVQLYNNTGGASELGNFSIKGKLVYQLANASSGRSGSLTWEHTDYGDIEKYGEKEIKVANEFIFSGAQVEDIGDFTKKEMKPHDMYTLGLRGFHPYFEVGDLWTLTINHSLPASTSEQELIDVDVQVRGVSYQKNAKGIGETILSVRVPSGAWSKTTSTRAKVSVSGLPNQNLSRTNVITIAPGNNPGQADYHCTGTDDYLVINSAIAKLGSQGGGEIVLLKGYFYPNGNINIDYENITLTGEGINSTVLFKTAEAGGSNFIIISASLARITGIGFAFVGGFNYTGEHITIADAATPDSIVVDGCLFTNGFYGVYLNTATNVKILNNYISLGTIASSGSIGISSGAAGAIVTGNTISINTAGSFIGIELPGVNSIAAHNNINIIGTNSTGGGNAISVTDDNTQVGENGIYYSGTWDCAASVNGIAVYGDYCSINGNRIIGDNFVGTPNSRGIYTTGAHNTITGNIVTNVTNSGAGVGYGISFSPDSSNNNYTGNKATANDTNYVDAGTTNASSNNT